MTTIAKITKSKDNPFTYTDTGPWKVSERSQKLSIIYRNELVDIDKYFAAVKSITSEISFKVKDFSFLVPYELRDLKSVIEDSEYILDLNEGWDEDSAKKIPDAIWLDTINFIVEYAKHIYTNSNLIIAPPSINPLIDGSIDITWINKKARMLINFRNSHKKEAHFYADQYSDSAQVKGNFVTSIFNEYLVHWIKNFAR